MPTQEELDALAQQYPGLKRYQATSEGNLEKKTGGGEKAFKRMMQNKKQGGNDDFLGLNTDEHQTEMLDLDNKNGHPLGDFGGEPEDPNRFRTSAGPDKLGPPMTPGQVSERMQDGINQQDAQVFGDFNVQGETNKTEVSKGTPVGDKGIMRDQQHFGEKFAARQLSPESMDKSGFEGTTSQRSKKPPVSRKQARQDRRQARRNRRAQRRAGRK